MPRFIAFGPNRKIEYFYSSTGVKLTKKVTVINGQNTTITRTDYIGGFIYVNNVLSSVSLDDGRLVKNTNGVFESQYYLKDHLGNVRVVFGADSQGNVVELQEDHYYPYGMTMSGLSIVSSLANNFNYQGKEYQPEGFDTDGNNTLDTYLAWSDFDARFFDVQLGRWHVPDPANQYASPYVGMGNNPACGIDPDGMWAGPKEIFQLGDITKGSHELSGVEITGRPRGMFTGTNASSEGVGITLTGQENANSSQGRHSGGGNGSGNNNKYSTSRKDTGRNYPGGKPKARQETPQEKQAKAEKAKTRAKLAATQKELADAKQAKADAEKNPSGQGGDGKWGFGTYMGATFASGVGPTAEVGFVADSKGYAYNYLSIGIAVGAEASAGAGVIVVPQKNFNAKDWFGDGFGGSFNIPFTPFSLEYTQSLYNTNYRAGKAGVGVGFGGSVNLSYTIMIPVVPPELWSRLGQPR